MQRQDHKSPLRAQVIALRDMSIRDQRAALVLVDRIEEIDQDAERVRHAQKSRAEGRTAAVEALRTVLNATADYESAQRIVDLAEASFVPAFVAPARGSVAVHRRSHFAF